MIDAPLIISLETATLGGSVWLGRGKTQLAVSTGDPQVSQSNSLLRDISDCLDGAGVSLTEIDLLACASGPGSFTGLRIGIATLKALAASLDRPCVGTPTLHAVAHSAGPSMATVALLPAGRGELFAQMFSVSVVGGNNLVKPIDTAAHLSPQKLLERYGMIANLRWAGSGADLQRETIAKAACERGIEFGSQTETVSANAETGWMLMANPNNLASHVAALALQEYSKGNSQRPDELQAIYVRPSDAELAK